MKFKVKLFDAEGQELEIANKIISDLLFDSEQALAFFINAIRTCLPPNFQYEVISEKDKNNSEKNKEDSSILIKI